jgi:hypothetical protein
MLDVQLWLNGTSGAEVLKLAREDDPTLTDQVAV